MVALSRSCGGSTWGRATRPLWTEEELALYVAARRRKSARLDPGGDGAPAGGRAPKTAWAAGGGGGCVPAETGSEAANDSEEHSDPDGPAAGGTSEP